MRAERTVFLAGIAMIAAGLVLFYVIGAGGFVRNAGTFVGLGGIGVALAGVLLYLISKNEPPIGEDLGV